MDAPSAARVREWLRVNRGDETQEDLAAAITEATGWHLDRTRYSKYERSLPIGKKVLGHFVDYWTARGRPGPFDAASEPAQATETPDAAAALIAAMTGALLAQTRALTDLRADFVEARDTASSEREAMTKMLARLESQLAELQLPGGRAATASDQASGNR